MLITRTNRSLPAVHGRGQRTNPAGRHLVEARNPVITEAMDPHQACVLAESRRSQLVKKWAPVLNKCREIPRHKLATMATLMDNQYNLCNPEGRSVLLEDVTTTANIADFTRFALPMLRKSFARLICDNLVGVQAMSQPASLVFYIRYRYGMSKGQTVAGTQIMRQNTAQAYARQNAWALDPYYSSQEVRGETALIDGTGTVVGPHTLAHRPVLAGTVTVEVYESDAMANPACDEPVPCLRVGFDASGAPDVVVVGSCTAFTSVLAVDEANTSFDHSTGQVQITLGSGAFPAGAVARVHYEYDLEANPFQPDVTMSIDSDSIAAVTRKLKTSWSLEAAQDMKAVHNLEPESLLTDLMADETVAEIDREVLNDLIIAAAIRARHNFATAAGPTVNYTDRNIALLYKTLEVANIILRTTMRGPANWMVTSADISSKFEQLNDFRAADALVQEGTDVGVINAGTINGKLRLFKDPLFPNCKILLGFKGKTALDAGYIYAPYIPLLSTPTVYDPNSFTPNKGVMTRYGKKLLEDGSLYYGTVTVTNL